MKMRILLVGVLVLGFAMPTALAHHAADESEVSQEDYYVDADGPGIWEEVNGHDGLQTEKTTYPATNDQCENEIDSFEENDPATDDDDVCIAFPDRHIF